MEYTPENWIVKIPGIKIQMGGKDWVVPPLTLGQLRRLLPKVRQMTDVVGATMGEEQIGTVAEIVAAALSRNYPDVTEDVVLDVLDLGNAQDVLRAVLTGSGLKPGEAVAVGNGAISTAYSPPPADTAIQ